MESLVGHPKRPRLLPAFSIAPDVPHLGPLQTSADMPKQRIWRHRADGFVQTAVFRHPDFDTVGLLTFIGGG